MQANKVDAAGNVGIGTTSPAQALHIQHAVAGWEARFGQTAADHLDVSGNQFQAFNGGGAGSSLYLNYSNGGNIYTGAGNLGIGTTTVPTATSIYKATGNTVLNVIAATNTAYSALHISATNDNSTTGGYLHAFNSSYPGTGSFTPNTITLTSYLSSGLNLHTSIASAPIRFFTGGNAVSNQRMVIDGDGNVGIGSTSPTTKLDISGPSGVGDFDALLLAKTSGYGSTKFTQYYNSSSSYGLKFGMSAATTYRAGIALDSATNDNDGRIIFYTSNAEQARIDKNGNVGIGSTSPAQQLDVVGNVAFSKALMPNGNAGVSGYFLQSAGAGNPPVWTDTVAASSLKWNDLTDPDGNLSLSMGTNLTTFNWLTGTGTNNLFNLTSANSADGTGALLNVQTGTSSTVMPLRVRAGSTEALAVSASGNVGIGVTNPSTKLEIAGYVKVNTANAALYLTDPSNREYFVQSTAGNFRIYDNTSSKQPFVIYGGAENNVLSISASNVGIGVTNPTNKLQVTGSIYSTALTNPASGAGVDLGYSGAGQLRSRDWTGAVYMPLIYQASYHQFYIGANEKVRIDTNGNVGIGSTSPVTKLDVVGGIIHQSGNAVGLAGALSLENTYAGGNSWVFGEIFESGKLNIRNVGGAGNPTVMTFTNGANVGIGTTSPGAKFSVSGGNALFLSNAAETAEQIQLGRTANEGQIGIAASADQFFIGAVTSDMAIRNSGGGKLLLGANSGSVGPAITISTQGNVGIGSVSPAQQLDVVGNVAFTGALMPGGNAGIAGGYFLKSMGAGAAPVWTDQITATAVKWNELTDPDGNLALNHGTYTTTFNSSAATQTFFTINANSLTSGKGLYIASTATALTGNLAELVLSGSNAANTGNVLRVAQTGASSAAVPLMVTNLGTGASFRVNDETGDADTTPFIITANGNVGVGSTGPSSKLDIEGTT